MKYHPHMSPRALSTVENPLLGYPDRWELMKWYLCWRKYPYPSEVIAALMVLTRTKDYAHYPCPLDGGHWHIGRGGGGHSSNKRLIQAKRTFRKAVRDEIWSEYVVREEEEKRRDRVNT